MILNLENKKQEKTSIEEKAADTRSIFSKGTSLSLIYNEVVLRPGSV